VSAENLRLAAGGRIDRSRPVSFHFDGRRYQGFAGDTLASALLANRVGILGRSFRLHRPRGLFGVWSEEPNAIVDIGAGAELLPNLKATQVELVEGLAARSVNCWPNARFDVFAPLQALSRLMPAGFYYKTFFWPNWHWFEPVIRRAAGLGIAPRLPDPGRYEEQSEHCDVLVVGGGPAGLSAALAATRSGARVVLADDRPVLGGALQWEECLVENRPALQWVADVERELRAATRTRVLTRTTAFGCYDQNLVGLAERSVPGATVRERLWHVRAAQVVLATGAIERPIVFANNDVPGVMLTSAALSYAVQYAVRPGRRAVLVTNADSAYAAADGLRSRGVTIVAIVDTRGVASVGQGFTQRTGIPVLASHAPVRVLGSPAAHGIEVRGVAPDGNRWLALPPRRFECDLVCVSGGWTPSLHLFSQSGGRLRYDPERGALIPAAGPTGVRCAGAASGCFSLREALTEGFLAGRAAAEGAGARAECGAPPASPAQQASVSPFWASPRSGRRAAWVDLQNDVTQADLELSVRENLRSVEHVKRYTTIGMAVDQGKTSSMNALGLIAELTERSISELGTTTFRPPYDPMTLGTLAGRHVGTFYRPLRLTPINGWNLEHGAVFEDFGGWRRPAWYVRPGQSREACIRAEKRATRTAVSLFDGSPLGKIEVHGPDAATFLNRMYYNNMRTLEVGRGRYGLMLNEHGTVIDDGVCMRLAHNHYLVSTTSGGADRIFAQFEDWLQCEWPELRVLVTQVTSVWGNIAVAGPRARELVQRLGGDIDLAREVFPHLTVREGRLAGMPLRIARVGFTGELSFEISVRAGYTAALWEDLLAHGRDLGVEPMGVDALQELRTEKGFLHVGTDTDGRTLPADLGLGGILSRKSDDFVGRRSLERADAKREDRLQFVGLAAEDPISVLPVGAHVIDEPKGRSGSQGYVTSSCGSEVLGRSVALGLVSAGRRRLGESVYVYSAGKVWPSRIVSPAWYDPDGERLRA
jgi:sarcosine oxidase subunit alpha